jgi:hypothetical protein
MGSVAGGAGIRRALVSLAVDALPDAPAIRRDLAASYPLFTLMSPAEAFTALGAQVQPAASGVAHVPRLVILNALVNYTFMTQGAVGPLGAEPALDGLLHALLANRPSASADAGPRPSIQSTPPAAPDPPTAPDPPGPPIGNDPSPFETLLDALQAAVAAANAAAAWAAFAAGAGSALNLSPGEVSKPVCDCSQTIVVEGIEAQVVTVTFEIGMPVEQLAHYPNPEWWPTCSVFFQAMNQIGMNVAKAAPAEDWIGTFEEVVELIPGYLLRTPLQFIFETVRSPAGLNKASVITGIRGSYQLVEKTADISVDQGYVEVQASALGPDQTTVTAVKVITFADPILQQFPSLACATFWGELCIDMATACSGP